MNSESCVLIRRFSTDGLIHPSHPESLAALKQTGVRSTNCSPQPCPSANRGAWRGILRGSVGGYILVTLVLCEHNPGKNIGLSRVLWFKEVAKTHTNCRLAALIPFSHPSLQLNPLTIVDHFKLWSNPLCQGLAD